MASAPSMSVSVECVSLCTLSKGDTSVRYECSVLSCAWKAPRVLTGSLASTPWPQCFSNSRKWPSRRSSRPEGLTYAPWGCEDSSGRKLSRRKNFDFVTSQKCIKSPNFPISSRTWKILCSSSESSHDISPESLWEDLKPKISYLEPEELELVNDALRLAFEAHDGQKRRSGDPFIIHPVEVARILGDLELDWESVAAGLLHDTVEDTNVVTFERIEKQFGSTVRRIVEGETKVSKLGKLQCKDPDISVQDVKADDLRQMFLAMTEEVRVIIVKLADRLHNMRTLTHMPQHKQASIALETLQVFAPLAKLLGMYHIKSELEYLSFMYTHPHDFAELKKRVEDLSKEHEKELEEAKKVLRRKIEQDQFLDFMTVKIEICSACKELYSIYKQMLKSKTSIKEVNQIAQLRLIITPKTQIGVGPLCSAQQICYHVLGLVHGIWTPIPSAMKDYIATPKPNGYQSLHTTVIPFLYESMFRLEVQVRTEEMDLIAVRGIAAHYSGRVVTDMDGHGLYRGRNLKGKPMCLNNADIALRIGWLNAIREWQEEFVGNMSSREFVDTVMRDLLGSRVFVFTPKGEIKNLPKGATVIDYAYLIHTDIGNKMVAAKVNGNLVSPMHALANAEVVEIITYNALSSKSAFQRHRQWLQHAKTRSARHKIMKFLREQAALSAAEITADTVNDFVADLEKENDYDPKFSILQNDRKSIWEKILASIDELPSIKKHRENLVHVKNTLGIPKINGKHNKAFQKGSVKVNGSSVISSDGFTELMHSTISMYNKEVLPGLEGWKASKIALWHSIEEHSVQWFCVICIDRRGMMAEVTSALTAVGMTICSCVAEVDRKKGMGVLLFHIEGTSENLINACSSVDVILGVLGWTAGCSWSKSAMDDNFFEC
ncbi:putative GTP diphosphokinase RSH1, chloroplastic [Dendrobium catenatum]|uniref:putative GTP diphosphokinase RSH1, chloroplastic n=1 Tax=Dendrobium catenatum TaxID=906689 RepID=UPI0009F4EB0D|nr:putative GTP diphosphokinase RSH1, chloroplastic [Dendrobium catenatum]